MSDFKSAARMLRTFSACLALGLLATMASANDAVLAALRQTQSPEELADVLNNAGLFEAPMERRSLLCFADHLPARDVNHLLVRLGWPGPYFGGQLGTARLIKAPRMPWQRLGDLEARPPVAVRFAVTDQGRVRGVWPEEDTPSDVMEVIREGLGRWRFEAPPSRFNNTGVVCRHQVLVPPSPPQDLDALPAITPDMVEAVTSADELLEMLAETGAVQAPERVRAALCSLPSEIDRSDLGPRLFAMGWPGPYSQSWIPSSAFQRPEKMKKGSTHPQYTELTRKQRIMGVVQVRFLISVRGHTQAFHVLESVHPDLSETTIQAIRQIQYTPTKVYNRPVSACAVKTVNFRLQ